MYRGKGSTQGWGGEDNGAGGFAHLKHPKSKVHAKYEVNISNSVVLIPYPFFINNSVIIGEGKSPPLPLLGRGPKFFILE